MGMESVCTGLQDGAGEAAIPGALSFGRIITVLFYFCLLCGYYGCNSTVRGFCWLSPPFPALSLHFMGWVQVAIIIPRSWGECQT